MSTARSQQKKLEALVARPSAPAGVVRRARVILLSAAGMDGEIAARLDLSPEGVSRIRRRFVDAGVDGLQDRPKAGHRDPGGIGEQLAALVTERPAKTPGLDCSPSRRGHVVQGFEGAAIGDQIRVRLKSSKSSAVSSISREQATHSAKGR